MKKNKTIILLAYVNRCVFPFIIFLLPGLFEKSYYLLVTSIGMILYGLYNYVGYKCQWKHIYCSYQYGNHQKMTPDNIKWNQVEKSDVYFIPMLSVVLASAMLLFYFIEQM